VTNEQYDVLADLEINPRMMIHGSAGTGKTVLAQEFAKRLDSRGTKVLLLFYNKGIAVKVRNAFQKRGNVQVGTFSSFAKRLIENIKPDWWEKHQKKGNEFWTLELPTSLLDIPLAKLPKFEAVIVDEGQDFKPEWFEFLERLLSDAKESFLTVFLDEHQDIFHHWKHFPCSPQPAKKVLTKNCRNTRRIVEYLNKVYPTEMTSFERSPVGTPIVQRYANNATEEQTQLVRDIKNLINIEHVAPGQIVILLSCSKAESCLANTHKIAGFPLESTYNGYDPKAKKIYYSAISIFKGMEADVVFVILDRRLAADELANALYVRGSRAKHLLYVYHPDEMAA
jgi:DNA helicase IV